MCGIVGICNLSANPPPAVDDLRAMLATIRHRGPDGFGVYHDARVGLGNARLSIIDIAGGDQPISNEDGRLWIVFNGEIFNYVELRPELERKGHLFTTQSDTEVLLHLYEEYGAACLERLNGQFAIAIWDASEQTLFLARDRVGIRPLFYTMTGGRLIFGSEIKSLLAFPGVHAEIDPRALDQVFRYWTALSPHTVFKGIEELPPGHWMLLRGDQVHTQAYWQLEFAAEPDRQRPLDDTLDEFESLLVDAAQIRLRADVPVGAYLSGGLDSSTIAAIIRRFTQRHLDTFSIAFSDPDFDESAYQRRMADFLGTEHQVVYARHADIGQVFPQVIWHAETPLLRSAPAPMYLLSGLVQRNHYKVVLTGEGADEFLAGYNIFKEAKIRRFWSRQPHSTLRPLLLKKLYPHIARMPHSMAYLASFFGGGLEELDSPDYSHAIRWRTTARTRRFFSTAMRQLMEDCSTPDAIAYPPDFLAWPALARAQYLESTIFLSGYLLSSQGDRMALAHSIEGRYPFLDHRVIEFCNRLPPEQKLFGLQEKYLLKRLAGRWLPDEIWQRAKRPYRAPIHRSFFNQETPEYVRELLSPANLRTAGIFNPSAVGQLVRKLDAGKPLGETDDMALAGILSSQLLYQQFVAAFNPPAPLAQSELLKVCGPVAKRV